MRKIAIILLFLISCTSCSPIFVEKDAFRINQKEPETSENKTEDSNDLRYYLIFEKDKEATITRIKRESEDDEDSINEDRDEGNSSDDDAEDHWDQGKSRFEESAFFSG